MFDPEAIEVALFEMLKTAVSDYKFNRFGRHALIWSSLSAMDLPALQLMPGGYMTVQDQEYGLPKYEFEHYVIVYAFADPDPDAIPQQILNAASLAIQKTFRSRPPGEAQKLKTVAAPNGLVENCWIDGMVNYAPGQLVQQLACVMPIKGITGF